jgi:hypothetical protein
MESIWASFGTLVLGNPSLNLSSAYDLLQAVLRFKIQIINWILGRSDRIFQLHTKTTKVRTDEILDLVDPLDNLVEIAVEQGSYVTKIRSGTLELLEDYIKGISVLFQWKLFNNSVTSERPLDVVPRLLSLNTELGYPVLKIFGGHLLRYRNILSPKVKCNYQDLVVLATLRSVGRSLPPSSDERVYKDAQESLKTWATPFGLSKDSQSLFKRNLDKVCHDIKVHRVPIHSHISLTSSALYDTPRSKGGQVEEVKNSIKLFDRLDWEIRLAVIPVSLTDTLCDALGNRATTMRSLQSRQKVPIINYLYRSLQTEHSFTVKCKKLGLPNTVAHQSGHCILLFATGEALKYGSYFPNPHLIIECGGIQLPFWKEGTVVSYKPRVIDVRLAASATAGCKTRIITVNRLYTAIIGAYMHHQFERVLNYSPVYKMGQSLLWYAVEQISLDKKRFFYSQDLKSSTDYIPHQLITLIWNTVCRKIRYNNENHPFLVFSKLITFPRNVFVPKTLGGEYYTLTHRGSLMGDPMSFMTLSLMCLVIDRCIKNMHGYYIHSPSLVLGDDYVTKLQTLADCKQASKITESFGLCLSRKHGFSKRALVFAESVAVVHEKQLHFVDSLKLRLLTLTPSTRMGEQSVSFLGKSRELKKYIEYTSSGSMKIIGTYVFWENIRVFYGEDVLKCPLPLWLPIELGGLDFPMRKFNGKWDCKYIHYFNHFTQLSDNEQFCEAIQLQNLYHNNRKSIWDDIDLAVKVFLKYFEKYKHGTSFDGIKRGYFYNRKDLRLFFLDSKNDNPSLSGVTEYELSLRDANIYSLRYILDIINRHISFSQLLSDRKKPRIPSIFKWMSNAKHFWKPRILNRPSDEDTLFMPIASIVKHMNALLDVFIYLPRDSLFGSDSYSLRLNRVDLLGNKFYATSPDFVGVYGSQIYTGRETDFDDFDVSNDFCGTMSAIQDSFLESFWIVDE